MVVASLADGSGDVVVVALLMLRDFLNFDGIRVFVTAVVIGGVRSFSC